MLRLTKIPFYRLFYYWGWPPMLPLNYTFSLSYKCNSRCYSCNIWQKKAGKELSLEEWKKIFSSLGKSPFWVTISGGEPFLRQDLVEICQSLYQICQPKIITIPTNGLLSEIIFKKTKAIIKNSPQSRIIINLSLDGIKDKHDQIRGVKGNFKKAMRTYQLLRKIKSSNFNLGIHTVISKKNVDHFPALGDFVLDGLKPDSYVTEIAENRVELGTMNKDISPNLRDYKKAVEYLKLKAHPPAGGSKLKAFNRWIQRFRWVYYDLVQEIIKRKTQVIPCFSGIASAQIAPNGDVWPCCVRADVWGNLKKENYDFKKIWFSKKAKEARKSIKNRECYCPLANVSYTNILISPKMMAKVIFLR